MHVAIWKDGYQQGGLLIEWRNWYHRCAESDVGDVEIVLVRIAFD